MSVRAKFQLSSWSRSGWKVCGGGVVGGVGWSRPSLGFSCSQAEQQQQLSKPNVTQLNSTQLKATQKQLRWVRLSSHLEPTPPPHTTPNFSVTSRPVRELEFGTDTHNTKLIN